MPTLYEQPIKRKAEKPLPSAVKHLGLLEAYSIRPTDIRFETQEQNEKIVLFLRQHLVLLLPWLAVGAVMLFVPTVLFPMVNRIIPFAIQVPATFWVVAAAFWYVVTFGFILNKLLRWHYNIYIVTTQRIIDIDFVNLLDKEFSETKLSRVQDISYRTTGFLATVFNYGDVYIQTAGEQPNFVFESVPRPGEVVEVISDMTKGGKPV